MMVVRSLGIILALATGGVGGAAPRPGAAASSRFRRSRATTAMRRSTSRPIASRCRTAPTAPFSPATSTSTQAELTLDTARLTVAYSGGAGSTGGARSRSTASTPPAEWSCSSPSETATRRLRHLRSRPQADHADRQRASSIASEQRVNGARLVIDLDSGRAVVDGGPPGVNQSGGRVTGHFTVPQNNKQRHAQVDRRR